VQLAAEHISKSFGPTRALDDISITLQTGEVRALVGENGAGKSTLLKILAGAVQADAGEMRLDDLTYSPRDLSEAARHGVAIVFQESTINPALGVAENVYIDRLRDFRGRLGFLDRPSLDRAAQGILESIGANISVKANLASLDFGRWKVIEIARALSNRPRVLLLDESTASLNTEEVRIFLGVVRNLHDEGLAVAFVSHHLDEVGEVGDTITILKDGRKVGDYRPTELDTKAMEALMVGREIGPNMYPKPSAGPAGEVLLELVDVSVPGQVSGVSLQLREGEILGLAGLKGSGSEGILEAIYGGAPAKTGEMRFRGAPYRPRRISDAWQCGIAYLPGDRAAEGLIEDFSVLENLTLAVRPRRGPFFDTGTARAITERAIIDMQIKTTSVQAPCRSLSGGNQQKVVLGKCLAVRPRLLLLNNPTRGIDVGSRMEIYRLLRQLAEEGSAVLLLSDDLLELIGIADRIVVTRQGRISRTFSRAEAPSERAIVTHMI
jgi:ABC-type sugar transport system ATPase subunit